jgi:hypothetical protein
MNLALNERVRLVLESEAVYNPLRWPEFQGVNPDDFARWLTEFPAVKLLDSKDYAVVDHLSMLICTEPHSVSYRFDNEEEMEQFIENNQEEEDQSGWWRHGEFADFDEYARDFEGDFDYFRQVYTPHPEEKVPDYTLEQKRAYGVYEYGPYLFLKLPVDHDFVRREGINMRHCLASAYPSYCRRMEAKEIEVYSMTDTRDNLPKVDIEVALIKASYSQVKFDKPVVSQIRGPANECPPKDEYLEPLMAFFQNYGKEWQLTSHGVLNFDGRLDGDVVVARWRQLQAGAASAEHEL